MDLTFLWFAGPVLAAILAFFLGKMRGKWIYIFIGLLVALSLWNYSVLQQSIGDAGWVPALLLIFITLPSLVLSVILGLIGRAFGPWRKR